MENNKRKINGLILVAVVIIVAIYAKSGGETDNAQAAWKRFVTSPEVKSHDYKYFRAGE